MKTTSTLQSYIGSAIIALSLVLFMSTLASGQCINPWAYMTANAPTSGTTSISSCTYQQEYNTINNVAAATTYTSTYSLGGCITVTQGSPAGPVVATGSSPLTWTSTVAGTYYVHYTTTCAPGCGQATSCGATSIAFVSGGGGGGGGSGPCASITPLIGCGTSTSATMSGTGAGWNITSCGWSTPGTEMIFSFTATSTGTHSIDITSISGGFVDFFWMDASTGCSSLSSAWNCISDIFTTGNYGAMPWVAGNTYYILLDPEGTGSYNVVFDVNCPNPGGPVTASDCATAQPVCTNLAFQIDPNGYGLIDELCVGCTSNPLVNPSSSNSGCLQNGELNSTWFTVNVAAGGSLEFSFGAPGGGFNCFDWIMWPYDPLTTCTDIINGVEPPVACNWNSPCDGFTGMSGAPLPVGAFAGNFEPAMTVSTGEQYLICFSNFSSALTTVPLDFFGTADISCTLLPVEIAELMGAGMEGYNQLTWKTLSEVHNDHFDVESSTDGVNFTKIGEVKGAGTSVQESDYRFNDFNVENDMTYYRLKQVDFSGDYKYSDIVAIAKRTSNAMEIVSAYPNPASDVFTIQLMLPESASIDLNITEPNGTVITSRSNNFKKGLNIIEIPVADFSSGIYFVNITNRMSQEKEVIKVAIK